MSEREQGLSREELYAGQSPEMLRIHKVNLLGRIAVIEADVHIINKILGIEGDVEQQEWIG